MAYISAIAVDFGSTNSGCCRISSFDYNGNLTYTAPAFLHDIGNYANPNNPQLNVEVNLKFDYRPECQYKLEVDFDEAQISNALHYIFSEYESGEIVKSNAVR